MKRKKENMEKKNNNSITEIKIENLNQPKLKKYNKSVDHNCWLLSKLSQFFRWMQNRAKIRPNVALVRKNCAASLQFLTLARQQIGKISTKECPLGVLVARNRFRIKFGSDKKYENIF